MALPGFNADASLYVSLEQYRSTVPVGVPTHAVAIPQQEQDDCEKTCGRTGSHRCYCECGGGIWIHGHCY
jgi:hypothetical protein